MCLVFRILSFWKVQHLLSFPLMGFRGVGIEGGKTTESSTRNLSLRIQNFATLSTPKPTGGSTYNVLNNNALCGYYRLCIHLGSLQIWHNGACEIGWVERIWMLSSYWLNSLENWMLRRLFSFNRRLFSFNRRLFSDKRSLLFSKRSLLLIVRSLVILGAESVESVACLFWLYGRSFCPMK